MRKKHLLSIVFGLVAALQLQAQEVPTDIGIYRTYSTQKWLELVRKEPSVISTMQNIERYAFDFRSQGSIEPAIIPVVIHLLPLPSGEEISEEDVWAQLNRLNLDFSAPRHPYLDEAYQQPSQVFDQLGNMLGSEADEKFYLSITDKKEHFSEHAGNPQIQFCLANIDPKGEPTTGILKATTTTNTWPMAEKLMLDESGYNTTWPADQYLNIWVARLDDAAGAGWAQLPGGPATTDGIVIDDRFFVRAATAETPNVTLTHLAGSYLNLYELWNDTELCADDYVDDTPIHNASNYGLTDYQYRHVSTCEGNPVEMVSNLMDNANDEQQYLFTWGQIMRMHATLSPEGVRSGLRKQTSNCAPKEGIVEGGSIDERLKNHQTLTGNMTVKVSPNPTSGDFMLDIQMQDIEIAATTEIRIFNQMGEIVWEQIGHSNQPTLQIQVHAQYWPKGSYTAQITRGKYIQSVRVLID
jgi:hypothetical protein